ncbi:MAG TPA: hypothetical protein VEC16_00125 [Alphaproteobacteria bacterium]|nr:hypothetical protein [Alphaproteobacteria bacterium]
MLDEKKLKDAFKKIRSERDEHLESINELTNELQSAFEYISDLENKYEKLKEVTDELLMFKNSMLLSDISHFSNIVLSLDEQKLFLTMYVFGEKEPLSYKYLTKKLSVEQSVVQALLSSLLDKKIPITRERISNEWYFNIDNRFRELQTKENVIKIHESVSKGIYEKSLSNFF